MLTPLDSSVSVPIYIGMHERHLSIDELRAVMAMMIHWLQHRQEGEEKVEGLHDDVLRLH